MKKNFLKKQKGSTLYFALVILSIASMIVFAVGSILALQIKTIKTLGDSNLAFCAADTGIERTYYQAYKEGTIQAGTFSESLTPQLTYQVQVLEASDPECVGVQFYCIRSVGTYLPSGVQRRIWAGI